MHRVRINSRNIRVSILASWLDPSGQPYSINCNARYCAPVSRGIGTNGPNRQKTCPAPARDGASVPRASVSVSFSFTSAPAASHDTASTARTQSSPDHQAVADHACFPLSLFPLSPPAPASLSLPLSQAPSASAHTDAVAQPSPCPPHTQNTSASKTPKNIPRGGPPGLEQHFYCHSPSGLDLDALPLRL